MWWWPGLEWSWPLHWKSRYSKKCRAAFRISRSHWCELHIPREIGILSVPSRTCCYLIISPETPQMSTVLPIILLTRVLNDLPRVTELVCHQPRVWIQLSGCEFSSGICKILPYQYFPWTEDKIGITYFFHFKGSVLSTKLRVGSAYIQTKAG